MKYNLITLFLVFALSAFGQNPPSDDPNDLLRKNKGVEEPQAYTLFNYKGKPATYKKMVKDAADADIVFFGELHNNPISHWLQYELARDLYAQKASQLVLGAEMFESDDQLLINEYFLGQISQKSFEEEARVWGNYETDYKPLLEFARESGLRFVATNIPRRYASMVYKEGLDRLEDLSDYSKVYIAPLPIDVDLEIPCYQKMLEMSGGNERFPHAQMVKDATMAYFILNNWTSGETFLHFNGAFHSDYREGIIHYIRQKKPHLNILVISTVEQEDTSELYDENMDKGDYIITVPSYMTKTH